MGKRPLGLGKSKKQKKQKVTSDGTDSKSEQSPNQIHIVLDDDSNLDDELVQLKGFWGSFTKDPENQLVLNGVVHECDRLLRNQEEEKLNLDEEFHSIYAQALAELTVFLGDEENEKKKYRLMNDFFETALDRIQTGLEQNPDSKLLLLVKSKVTFQRIPLQYVSTLGLKDTNGDELQLNELLEDAKKSFSHVKNQERLIHNVLLGFYDLLDIVESFEGRIELEDGLDSDNEDEEIDIVLDEKHPLKKIKHQLKNNYNWLEQNLRFAYDNLKLLPLSEDNREELIALRRDTARTLGQVYLKFAEQPSKEFARLMYDSDDEDNSENAISGSSTEDIQKLAMSYVQSAIKYLMEAEDKDDPQSWVDIAEALIELGNIHDFESSEQEKAYSDAEAILKKANKATHGKYKDILENLLSAN